MIFDYGFTCSSARYFNRPHPRVADWAGLIQELAFGDEEFNTRWMTGNASLADLAARLARRVGLGAADIEACLRDGCRNLPENQSVVGLARSLKAQGLPIALVTLNYDVFNQVVAPAHGYDRLFDVIVNSCDHGTTDKEILWPIAFARLGRGVGYTDSLLIEDRDRETARFMARGGSAIRYVDEGSIGQAIGGFRFA